MLTKSDHQAVTDVSETDVWFMIPALLIRTLVGPKVVLTLSHKAVTEALSVKSVVIATSSIFFIDGVNLLHGLQGICRTYDQHGSLWTGLGERSGEP